MTAAKPTPQASQARQAGKPAARTPPVLGFCAVSGTGKTTLLKRLIPELCARCAVGVIKHAHHNFDTDQPGKDSYELRKAGARQMLVSSARRRALITELADGEAEPGLDRLIAELDGAALDLILVEGFKREAFPKIELRRGATDAPPICARDPHVIALACDRPDAPPAGVPSIPILNLNDAGAVAHFILTEFLMLN